MEKNLLIERAKEIIQYGQYLNRNSIFPLYSNPLLMKSLKESICLLLLANEEYLLSINKLSMCYTISLESDIKNRVRRDIAQENHCLREDIKEVTEETLTLLSILGLITIHLKHCIVREELTDYYLEFVSVYLLGIGNYLQRVLDTFIHDFLTLYL